MFEELTRFLPSFQDTQFGEWIIDHENDGSIEHPLQFPFVDYNRVVTEFMDSVYRFIDKHNSMELTRYAEILEDANIEWGLKSLSNADVSALDGRTVMAMIVGAIRAERFCDGALLGFCKDGSILRWLSRLKQIDGQGETGNVSR